LLSGLQGSKQDEKFIRLIRHPAEKRKSWWVNKIFTIKP
jgi:hypothetical protein